MSLELKRIKIWTENVRKKDMTPQKFSKCSPEATLNLIQIQWSLSVIFESKIKEIVYSSYGKEIYMF